MPPLLADFIHAGACIPICEKFLTRPSAAPSIEIPKGGAGPRPAESTKKDTTYVVSFFVVREAGVEPARPCEHWHLKPASLPIPPLAQVGLFLCIAQNE